MTYSSSVAPPYMSFMRRQAYKEGALLSGPTRDPSGWTKFPTAVMLGTYGSEAEKDQKRMRVDSTLYIANPLVYTRGTVIPCYLALSSQDISMLDVFASPKAPYVRLVRRLRYFKISDPGEAQRIESFGPDFGAAATMINSVDMGADRSQKLIRYEGKVGYMDLVEMECNTAVWWKPPKDMQQEEGVRWLEGEIHLPKDLAPNCDLEIFHLNVSSSLCSFEQDSSDELMRYA
ncbi:unnamed protein product [Cyclocybe aegerita]|uniref:Uncharacterized protein n=1 Tax=Cyclocybe aegerita TaxID=1973307 RepID=A0A8S0X0Z9_CYCAE|nr:unnamed protein product [Cyclocybe aegerita]